MVGPCLVAKAIVMVSQLSTYAEAAMTHATYATRTCMMKGGESQSKSQGGGYDQARRGGEEGVSTNLVSR